MLFGRKAQASQDLAAVIDPRFAPLEIVRIGTTEAPDARVDFALVGSDGLAAPLPPAVLLRPDGHLAWVAPRP